MLDVPSRRRGSQHRRVERQERLEAYGAFFKFLVDNPDYLGRLACVTPNTKANEFLGRAILSLYNFGMSDKEEHQLLVLFETALEEEVTKC